MIYAFSDYSGCGKPFCIAGTRDTRMVVEEVGLEKALLGCKGGLALDQAVGTSQEDRICRSGRRR